MHVRIAFFLMLCMVQLAYSQDYPGYNTSNFAGVNSVFFNPSGMAGSPSRWDVNVLSLHASAENSVGSFNLGNYSSLYKGNELLNQYRAVNAAPATGYLNLNVHGPSVMVRLNERSSVALTTRARLMVNARNIDGRLIDEIATRGSGSANLPHTFSNYDNMTINSNGWGEVGLSYATIVKDDDLHQIKVGATVRYLAGMVNTYLQTQHLQGTMAHDPVSNETYLTNVSGSLYTGYGGVRLGNFEPSYLFNYNSHGVGGDVGFTYTYEPNEDGYYADNWWGASEPLYKFKIGVALTDIGMIRYRRNDGNRFSIEVDATERLYTDELRTLQVDYETYFESRPDYFVPLPWQRPNFYNVALPAMLRVDADYHVRGAAYVNLMGHMSLVNNIGSPWGQGGYHSITLTPRVENRFWGIYLPVNYNQLSKFNAGLSLRAGYFFIGSGSVLSMLYKSRRLDVHAGIRFSALDRDGGGGGIWRKTRSRTDCWKN
ncbi:MAG: hypothetical protein KIT80_15435 [Chitinophagaceae bacterium]|nr:hypothetical protein [Chitinophagaceae bacterium]MCW5928307.1 hypothetical protein [Chitinophagaceae bacterium]